MTMTTYPSSPSIPEEVWAALREAQDTAERESGAPLLPCKVGGLSGREKNYGKPCVPVAGLYDTTLRMSCRWCGNG